MAAERHEDDLQLTEQKVGLKEDIDQEMKSEEGVIDKSYTFHSTFTSSESTTPTDREKCADQTQTDSGSLSEATSSKQVKKDAGFNSFKMPAFGPRPGLKKPAIKPIVSENKAKSEHKSGPPKVAEKKILSSDSAKSNLTGLEPVEESKIRTVSESTEGSKESKQETTKSEKIKEHSSSSKQSSKSQQSVKFQQLSPAEKRQQQTVPIPYKEPSWGGATDKKYSFEVLKNGTIIDNIDLTEKSFFVFGRLPSCDVTMEHPSLSRYHAVVQHCKVPNESHDVGWYLYDLDSTHGTWVNKNKLKPRVYYRLRVGHVIKLGGSTRLNILQGPPDDQDEEAELSVTEMKQLREKQLKEVEVLKQAELQALEQKAEKEKEAMEDTGCSWGMDGNDALEEEGENPFSQAEPLNEDLYLDDPKKTLRGWFEREGHDLPEYDIVDAGLGKFRCSVELPIDTVTGQPVVAEVTMSGKKKEVVVACALEACRTLDRHQVLRQANHESRKRKLKNWEDNDFYGSDDDSFFDRTGSIEQKRKIRMKKAGKANDKAETYNSLVSKLESIGEEMAEIEAKLEKAKEEAAKREMEDLDELDAYMSSLKDGAMDTKTKMALKRRLFELRQEEQKVRRLANIAKPANMPELKKFESKRETHVSNQPMIGKKKALVPGHKKTLIPKAHIETVPAHSQRDNEEEEEEEDEEEDVPPPKKETPMEVERLSDDKHAEQEQGASVSGNGAQLKEKGMKEAQSQGIKGPALPPGWAQEATIADDEEESNKKDESQPEQEVPQKSRRKRPPRIRPQIPKNPKEVKQSYPSDDADYAVWVPPADQSGDGRTKLNEKYGY